MSVTDAQQLIFRHARQAFGGIPKVICHHHDFSSLTIDMLYCVDRPCRGVTSYSTIGLSSHELRDNDGDKVTFGLEIAGACASMNGDYANVLASVAFHIIRTGVIAVPGQALEGYVSEYYPLTTVPHVYFTAPYLWSGLSMLSLKRRTKNRRLNHLAFARS